MEEAVAIEIIALLKTNKVLLYWLMGLLSVVGVIASAGVISFLVNVRGIIKAIKNYHEIVKIDRLKEYVSIREETAFMKADMEAQEQIQKAVQNAMESVEKVLKDKDKEEKKRKEIFAEYLKTAKDLMRITTDLMIFVDVKDRKEVTKAVMKDKKSIAAEVVYEQLQGLKFLKEILSPRDRANALVVQSALHALVGDSGKGIDLIDVKKEDPDTD